MRPRSYFIAVVIIMVIMIGGYYYLEDTSEYTEHLYCSPGSRIVEVCLDRNSPVCGWFDPQTVRCFAYPCAANFTNECLACKDDKVVYYTPGPCPEPG